MIKFFANLASLKGDKKGVAAMEYGLIAVLISLTIYGGAQIAGNQLKNIFNNIGSDL